MRSLRYLSRALVALPLLIALNNLQPTLAATTPPSGKIYGVNLGSWLLLEPWMLPKEWLAMGGESCDPCRNCIASEFAFAQAYPDTVGGFFDKHWSSWFTQDDVNRIASYGMNTVRIPLGYWIVEPLVDRSTEFYPRGGMKQLKRGLRQLKAAGIKVVLDHHALPGVQNANQMFTGRCTEDVQFYTDYNYHRALVWTAVMTALSHLDPDFGSVFAIEAVNEPIMDATQTPGYGDFQKNFSHSGCRTLLGIVDFDKTASDDLLDSTLLKTSNATESFLRGKRFGGEIGSVLFDAATMLAQIAIECGIDAIFGHNIASKTQLTTMQMDINWQYNDPPNPADAARGPQIYDNHLYYAYGGVADANIDAYLNHSCHLDRVESDAALGNSPLVFGEWSLAVNFNATDEDLRKWADAQKSAYSKGAGWIFWNFKTEESELDSGYPRGWSYYYCVERGYLTKDPSQLIDKHVCDPYLSTNTTTNTIATNTTAISVSRLHKKAEKMY